MTWYDTVMLSTDATNQWLRCPAEWLSNHRVAVLCGFVDVTCTDFIPNRLWLLLLSPTFGPGQICTLRTA
jgi:hypothetical protein